MRNRRPYFIFDFETDGKHPEECNPVQVAAVVIDPMKLEIIPGSEFNSMMKPPGIDEKEEYLTDARRETLMWHARIRKEDPDVIFDSWANAPDTELVWNLFSKFVNKFNSTGKQWNAPVPGGANISSFDLVIAKRLNEKYKIGTMFWPRDCDIVDVQRQAYSWFEGIDYGPNDYKVDTLRKYFQMDLEGGHDALVDTKDCASLIIRFLHLSRHCAANVPKFKEYHDALKAKKKKKK